MAALTRDEIEQMHEKLRTAFASVIADWDWDSRYAADARKREAARDLATTASALLQADERLREFDRDLIAKPAAPKLQAKT